MDRALQKSDREWEERIRWQLARALASTKTSRPQRDMYSDEAEYVIRLAARNLGLNETTIIRYARELHRSATEEPIE